VRARWQHDAVAREQKSGGRHEDGRLEKVGRFACETRTGKCQIVSRNPDYGARRRAALRAIKFGWKIARARRILCGRDQVPVFT